MLFCSSTSCRHAVDFVQLKANNKHENQRLNLSGVCVRYVKNGAIFEASKHMRTCGNKLNFSTLSFGIDEIYCSGISHIPLLSSVKSSRLTPRCRAMTLEAPPRESSNPIHFGVYVCRKYKHFFLLRFAALLVKTST